MNKEFLSVLVFYFAAAMLMTVLSVGTHAQVKGVFYGVDFNDSLGSVKTKLSKHCSSTKVISIESPNFPLAKDREQHFICEGIKLGDDLIKEVIKLLVLIGKESNHKSKYVESLTKIKNDMDVVESSESIKNEIKKWLDDAITEINQSN